MPIHIAPILRNRELALESAGLINAINSDGYTVIKNQEAAGLRPIQVPVQTFHFNGKPYVSKE
jgi:hypothetical protein